MAVDSAYPQIMGTAVEQLGRTSWRAIVSMSGYQWVGKGLTPGVAVSRLYETIGRRRRDAEGAEKEALEVLYGQA